MQKIGDYKFAEVETEILDFWSKSRIYYKAKEKNAGKKKFYYLDGPPYTSGRIHIGHAWGKALRDSLMRYKRMKGFDVWDRAGFDMHGLPTEHATQKKLNLPEKEDILKYGLQNFILECKKLAIENMHSMIKDFKNMGVWMDFDNPYKPIDSSFIESEWWLIKKAHENGRLYEGQKTITWCKECASALAKHELDYENIADKSIYVKFPVVGQKDEFLIIWTTTPWTIAFNLAVMVNPDVTYVKCMVGFEKWIIAKELAIPFITQILDRDFEVLEEFKGAKLEGLKYKHPFENEIKHFVEIEKTSNKLHTVVLSKEYVDTTTGTGLVHCAPGCGPEDYEVGHKNGLPPFNEIDEKGVFPESMGKFKGLIAKKDDDVFVNELDDRGSLITQQRVQHDYAHCWRCHKPVVFRTTKQWFFKVEDLKENMKEINKSIYWVPEWAGSRQFHSWLDNLRDNSITKQRYWGTPVPIWKCSKCGNYEVIGSIKELKEKANFVPEDLHLPWIDKVTIECKCGEQMKRIPDILDVWVDAGCTSWICLDYPSREDLFKKLFPADFILEGKDQIRGWFNLLFVCSMVSMNTHSFNAVYMHGMINDALGRKMSKSEGNYILPDEVVSKYGSDSMRYYMIGGTGAGLDLNYNFDDMKTKFKNLSILWNLHKLLIDMYRNNKMDYKGTANDKLDEEEKYILSKTHSTIKKTTELFDKYFLNDVPVCVENLFLELSRTYIQLVRDKMSLGTDEEKQAVFDTIYEVLLASLKLFAPISPFIAEKIYQNLKTEFGLKEESIHLFDWPVYNEEMIDAQLEENFGVAKDTIQSILGAREKIQLGVRWPLKEVTLVSKDDKTTSAINKLSHLIRKQANVKEIKIVKEFTQAKLKVKPNYKTLGPDFGQLAPSIMTKLLQETENSILKHLQKGRFELKVNDKKIELLEKHFVIEKILPENYLAYEFKHGDLFVDKTRTPELDAEGMAREITRRVQALRKNNELVKRDRIKLFIGMKEFGQIEPWQDEIKEKCGASEISLNETIKETKYSSEEKIKDKTIKISFEVVS